ncbi:hypothetical protein HDU96_008838 [Phlyctochytrium bullatum]|nr:hypothetical protein HDU96_008838 [Phlyctochytrium bullatum]
MSLANNAGADLEKACGPGVASLDCRLVWRQGSKRHILLATDEDSDLPFTTKYRLLNQPAGLCALQYTTTQGCNTIYQFEPPFTPRIYHPPARQFFRNATTPPLSLDAAYAEEVRLTAQLTVDAAVGVTMLVRADANANRNGPVSTYDTASPIFVKRQAELAAAGVAGETPSGIHTAMLQYGDPRVASEDPDTLTGFNLRGTVDGLARAGLSGSFQALALGAGGRFRNLSRLVPPA